MFGASFQSGFGGFNTLQNQQPQQQQQQQQLLRQTVQTGTTVIDQQTNGTGNPQFKAVPVQDSGSKTSGSQPTTVYLQSITAMNHYSTKSFEELRFEDYMKGNKAPGVKPGGTLGLGLGNNTGTNLLLGNQPQQQQQPFNPLAAGTTTGLGGFTAPSSAAAGQQGSLNLPFMGNTSTNTGGGFTLGNTMQTTAFPLSTPASTFTTGNNTFMKPAGTALATTNPLGGGSNMFSPPTGGLSTNMFASNNDKKTSFLNTTFNAPGTTSTTAAFPSTGATNTGFNLFNPTTTVPAPSFFPTTTSTNTANTNSGFNFPIPSFTSPTATTNTSNNSGINFQPQTSFTSNAFQFPVQQNFQQTGFQQQQQQQQQQNGLTFPAQIQPPAPPQPIYSTSAIAQKLDFLVKKKDDFIGEVPPTKKDNGNANSSSTSSEGGSKPSTDPSFSSGINFAATYTTSSSSGTSFSGHSYASSSTRRIVPRGMRSKLMETNLTTMNDFQQVNPASIQTNNFAEVPGNFQRIQDVRSQNNSVGINSLLPQTNHLRLPPVLEIIDQMQPPIQLTLPAKTPEKKQTSPIGGSLSLPLPATGFTPYSFDTPVLSTRQLLKPDDLSMLGGGGQVNRGNSDRKLARAVSTEETGSSSAKKDQTASFPQNGDGIEYLDLYANGYHTNPDLRHLTSDEMTEIYRFTVIRPNYGEIQWLEPVNIVGLNLATIISIRAKEVFVYDDVPPPPVGQGLNKPAKITLFNVFPKVKNEVGFSGLIEKLKSFCQVEDADFVSYEREGGLWTFNVKHFSRYGFFDDEDEDDPIHMEVDKPVAAGHPMSTESTATTEYATATSFPPDTSPGVTEQAPAPIQNIEKLKNLLILKNPAAVSPEKVKVEETPVEAPLITRFPSMRELVGTGKDSSKTISSTALTVKSTIIPTEQRLTKTHNFMMNTFRVGWSADGRIAIPHIQGGGKISVKIKSLTNTSIYGQSEDERDFFRQSIEFISTLSLQHPRPEDQFAHFMQYLRMKLGQFAPSSINDQFIFAVYLIHALFGQLDLHPRNPLPVYSVQSPANEKEPESYQRRCQLIQQYLQQASRQYTSLEEMDVVDYYLHTNQLQSLTTQLMNQGMYRTALIACQVGSDLSHLALQQQQLLTWNAIEQSEVKLKKLFNLSSGWSDGQQDVFEKATHWTQVISMVYDYFYQNEGNLSGAVDFYQELVSQQAVVPPTRSGNSEVESGVYRLLKLLCLPARQISSDHVEEEVRAQLLKEALQNEGFTDNQLDFHHTFIVLTLLEQLQFIPPTQAYLSGFIRQQYIYQLMQLNEWKSVFHVAHTFPFAADRVRVMEECIYVCPLAVKLSLLGENFFLRHYSGGVGGAASLHSSTIPSGRSTKTSEAFTQYSELLFYSIFTSMPLHSSSNQLFNTFYSQYFKDYSTVITTKSSYLTTQRETSNTIEGRLRFKALQRGQEIFLQAMIQSFILYFAENISQISPSASVLPSGGDGEGEAAERPSERSYFSKVLSFLQLFHRFVEDSIVSIISTSSLENVWIGLYLLLFRYLNILQLIGTIQQSKQTTLEEQEQILSFTSELYREGVALQGEIMNLLYRPWTLLGQEKEIQIMLRMILSHLLRIIIAIDRTSSVASGSTAGGWSSKVLFDQHIELIARTVPTSLLTEAVDHSIYHLILGQAYQL